MSRTLIPLRRIDGTPSEMSDEALLAACATGESAALGALFDRYNAAVYRFLASRSGTNEGDLDDLVQKTFVIVGRSAARFDGRSSARTWIFGVANNVARHYVRSEVRRKRALASVSEGELTVERVESPPAEVSETRRALAAAIAELPHALRETFLLVYVEGMSGVEAAEALGCREGAIYKRLHTARKKLRETLGDFR